MGLLTIPGQLAPENLIPLRALDHASAIVGRLTAFRRLKHNWLWLSWLLLRLSNVTTCGTGISSYPTSESSVS